MFFHLFQLLSSMPSQHHQICHELIAIVVIQAKSTTKATVQTQEVCMTIEANENLLKSKQRQVELYNQMPSQIQLPSQQEHDIVDPQFLRLKRIR